MIYGNKEGIRDSLLAQLETLYDLEIPAEVFAPAELLDVLAAFTCAINREISMYISRSGEVLDITIGGTGSVELKDIHLRRNTRRLSMVRCIHTHPGGNPQLSDVDISSLRADGGSWREGWSCDRYTGGVSGRICRRRQSNPSDGYYACSQNSAETMDGCHRAGRP